MTRVRDVLAFICTSYPYPWHLSKARLTKLVYLADWRAALKLGRPITSTQWIFNYYGPYVEDVVDSVRSDSAFRVNRTFNSFGDQKELVSLAHPTEWPSLSQPQQDLVRFVITQTSDLNWTEFIQLVYSTYPVRVSPRHTPLNLEWLARDYRRLQQQIDSDPTASLGADSYQTGTFELR